MVGESSWKCWAWVGCLAIVSACSDSASESGPLDAAGADAGGNVEGGQDVSQQDVDDPMEAGGDTAADVVADAPVQQDGEPVPDASEEAATDAAAHPDTGEPLAAACQTAGGVLCTPNRWDVCPVGYEPVDVDAGHLGCGAGLGWCCQPAPSSTCSAEPLTNCIPGKCTGCWQAALDETLTCESGRSCCQDVWK